jgi:hypothetical protein
LQDVAEILHGVRPEQDRPCVVCGEDVQEHDSRRPDARYCSAKCRQRAYRARVIGRESGEQQTCHEPARGDISSRVSASDVSHEQWTAM